MYTFRESAFSTWNLKLDPLSSKLETRSSRRETRSSKVSRIENRVSRLDPWSSWLSTYFWAVLYFWNDSWVQTFHRHAYWPLKVHNVKSLKSHLTYTMLKIITQDTFEQRRSHCYFTLTVVARLEEWQIQKCFLCCHLSKCKLTLGFGHHNFKQDDFWPTWSVACKMYLVQWWGPPKGAVCMSLV